MSDEMERWDFSDNENGCDAMVLSEDGEFVEYEVAIRRIRELDERLHERDLAVAELVEDRNKWIAAGAKESRRATEAEQKLADRDAAWERAIEAWWNKGRRASDSKDFLAAIREILEAEGGWA